MEILQDGFVGRLNLSLLEIEKNGIVLLGNERPELYNVYGIAHGGYLYTLGHIAAQLTGELCLGGNWQVSNATCQYLNPMRHFPVRAETQCVGADEDSPYLQVRIYDSRDLLCFTQSIVLKDCAAPDRRVTHTPTIHDALPLPRSCFEELRFPCLSSTFAKFMNIYSIGRKESGIIYAVDLSEVNCDDYGFVHPGALFTAADAASGGSMFYIHKMRPITVSATIHYFRQTAAGPVSVVPRLVRGGRSLFYYDVDIIDDEGSPVAAAHFIMQNTMTMTEEKSEI